MTGTASINSLETSWHDIQVDVVEELQVWPDGPKDNTFNQGRLKLTGDDGSMLDLSVDNGDILTVDIAISDPGGERHTLTQPLTLWGDVMNVELLHYQDIWP